MDRYPDNHAGILRLIDVSTGEVGAEAPAELFGGWTLSFAPEDHVLLVTGNVAHARRWDFSHWRQPTALSGHTKEGSGLASSSNGPTNEVWDLAFSPDGRTLVSSSDDATLKLWDVATGQEQRTLKGHDTLVTAVKYSPDGNLLASAGWDKKVRLWNAHTGAPVVTLEGHRDHVRAVAFSPDGKTLASAGSDPDVRLWDLATMRELRAPLSGKSAWGLSLAFTFDGETLFSGGDDKNIKFWDWKEGRLRATCQAEDAVGSLALSPDGKTLALAQARGRVRLCDVDTQNIRATLLGHSADVLGVAFSPDGLTLATAGRDHTVRLWDPVTGLELLTLSGHAAPVQAIAFSPDGTILATGSHDGAIKLWRASTGSPDTNLRLTDIDASSIPTVLPTAQRH